MNKILIICGPTASGKSDLAVECAKLLKSEVVSADSMNVYKDLNVGTAKPNSDDMRGIKHHLIDVVNCDKTFSVGDYRELALPIVNALCKDNKTPIICGGTGFYINSIIYNMSYGNSPSNMEAREKYFSLAEKYGNEYVYNILIEKDEKSAKKIHYNDVKRVVRALEIYESGFKKSEINDLLTPQFDYSAFSIDYPREELYKRIDIRVDKMIKNGLVEEVSSLVKKGLNEQYQSMQGIGYKEIYDYLKGNCSLEEAIYNIKLNTRHYAKRQITFFKKLPGLNYLKPDDPIKLAKIITEKYC